MKKYSIFVVTLVIAFLGFANISNVQAEDFTPTLSGANGSDSGTNQIVPIQEVTPVYTPPSSGANDSETGSIIPDGQSTNSNETDSIIPSSQGTNGNETGAIIPTAQGSNGDEGGSSNLIVTPPANPPAGNTKTDVPVVTIIAGGNSSSSGSSGSFYGGSTIIGTNASTTIGTCPLITSYMRLGETNDHVQVAKLQSFLKDTEGLNASVNGIFDQQTESAVEAFQTKYFSDIMGPWGVTKASGEVYITTVKKINQITCNTPLNLTPADLSIINAYKGAVAASGFTSKPVNGPVGVNNTPNVGNSVAVGPVVPTVAVASTSASSAENSSVANQNVAAVANASILTRFWSFIVGLFHR